MIALRHELAVYAITGLTVLVIALSSVDFRHGPLFREDGVVETAAAMLFLAALMVGLYRKLFRSVVGLSFCGIALLACLSEISFGARYFDFAMPAMTGGGELDGAQDLVMLAYRGAEANGLMPLVVVLMVIVPLLAAILAYRSGHLARIITWFNADSGRSTIAVAMAVIGLAVVLDVMEVARFAEELLELFGAGLFVTAALRLGR